MAVLSNGVGSGQSGVASVFPDTGARGGIASGASSVQDRENFGRGRVSGTARRKLENGTIAVVPHAVIRLHLWLGGNLIRQTLSGPEGAYLFEDIRVGSLYYVIGFYPDGSYNAVIADRVSAEPY